MSKSQRKFTRWEVPLTSDISTNLSVSIWLRSCSRFNRTWIEATVKLPCPVLTKASIPALSSLSAPSASHRTLLQAGPPSASARHTHTHKTQMRKSQFYCNRVKTGIDRIITHKYPQLISFRPVISLGGSGCKSVFVYLNEIRIIRNNLSSCLSDISISKLRCLTIYWEVDS